MAYSQASKLAKAKYLLKWFINKYEPVCYFCKEPIAPDSLYPKKNNGKQIDDFTIHHVDENRDNNENDNLEIAHRNCHIKHHKAKRKAEELKEAA